MAMKIVLKLDLHDDKDKQKALRAVSGLADLDAINVDMKTQRLTVVGGADPVAVASKLRKIWPSVQIVSVGPNKEEKKEGGGGGGDKGGDKPDLSKLVPYPYHYQYPYNYQYQYQRYPHYPQYGVHSAEEDPNSCVIC